MELYASHWHEKSTDALQRLAKVFSIDIHSAATLADVLVANSGVEVGQHIPSFVAWEGKLSASKKYSQGFSATGELVL